MQIKMAFRQKFAVESVQVHGFLPQILLARRCRLAQSRRHVRKPCRENVHGVAHFRSAIWLCRDAALVPRAEGKARRSRGTNSIRRLHCENSDTVSPCSTTGRGVLSVLINNFVVEKAGFTGREIGILQGLREVPGFLAFTAVFMLLIWRQQTFAILSFAVMGAGAAVVGFLPSVWGIYFTTVIMSLGFHYLATMEQSLAMQWTSARDLPVVLGRMTAIASLASLVTYGLVFAALTLLELSYLQIFLAGGGLTLGIAALCRFGFPHIAAVGLPPLRGLVWVLGERGRTTVFLLGAAIAAGSLVLALLVPSAPARGNEIARWTWRRSRAAA